MTKYAILLGYGLFDESNVKYRAYLDRFAKLVEKKGVDVAILCGGHTNLKSPEKSEASTMSDYLKRSLNSEVKLVLEDKSRTADENIKFAKEHIDFAPGNKVFLISDSVRFFKHFWLALHYWYGLNRGQIEEQWFIIAEKVYDNPEKINKHRAEGHEKIAGVQES